MSSFHGSSGHKLALLSNGALKFSRVTLDDAGTYQCLAQNEAGTAIGRTRLVLQGNTLHFYRAQTCCSNSTEALVDT